MTKLAEQLIDEVTNSWLKKIKAAAEPFGGYLKLAKSTWAVFQFEDHTRIDPFLNKLHRWTDVHDYGASMSRREVVVLQSGIMDDLPYPYSDYGLNIP